jgi:hypothetical protein
MALMLMIRRIDVLDVRKFSPQCFWFMNKRGETLRTNPLTASLISKGYQRDFRFCPAAIETPVDCF